MGHYIFAICLIIMVICAISGVANVRSIQLNTSHLGKLAEYQELFGKYSTTVQSTTLDLDEIDADMISVVAHKASHVPEGVLVEDTSLDIEGTDVGINVRWLLDNLDTLSGKRAKWTCLLAQRTGDQIHVYSGVVEGKIVPTAGNEGFGFDPYFLPDGTTQTLAESKPDSVNARALAIKAFIENNHLTSVGPIYNWAGSWQKHN